MMHNCYQKTDKGRVEIATRKYGLSLRIRSILLLIDGKKSSTDLMIAYPGLELTEALLQDLERQGFIALSSSRESKDDHAGPGLTRSSSSSSRRRSANKKAKSPVSTETSLILDTIFPPNLPFPREMLCEGSAMTMEDDHLRMRSSKAVMDEHPTLFDAIKSCYLDGLRDLSPNAVASFLRSLSRARTTRELADLRSAYLEALRVAKGSAAATRQDDELELLLFACEA